MMSSKAPSNVAPPTCAEGRCTGANGLLAGGPRFLGPCVPANCPCTRQRPSRPRDGGHCPSVVGCAPGVTAPPPTPPGAQEMLSLPACPSLLLPRWESRTPPRKWEEQICNRHWPLWAWLPAPGASASPATPTWPAPPGLGQAFPAPDHQLSPRAPRPQPPATRSFQEGTACCCPQPCRPAPAA